ncbi:MAG: ThiF family adenylyltransferase [Verrucomicrobiales bacterium]|nr:MAG: ThiF family adenylyltransferase [Verrucomicrobiales bacterium]
MFAKLVSHNDDLRQLIDKGYAVAFEPGHLIVRDVSYLDHEHNLHFGALVAKFNDVDGKRIVPTDHQAYFAGAQPHGLDGRPISSLGGGPTQLPLGEACKDVAVQRSFSNKPRKNGQFVDYANHFAKIENYVGIISGPAIELHGEKASPLTFRCVDHGENQAVFKFQDTLTSRAGITDLSQKFKDDVVAIIGLGGTGGYLLDLLVKTPVREIRAYDMDDYHVHNAYRSPGKLDPQELGKKKAEVCQSRYENFRHGLNIKTQFVDASCADDFNDVTFAFVCVDKGPSRAGIFDLLISKGIAFIDVGMGLHRQKNLLTGLIRTIYCPPEKAAQVRDSGWADLKSDPNDLYRTNIQIAELNALNACLAVIRFKQIRGFYAEESSILNLIFDLKDLGTVGETETP